MGMKEIKVGGAVGFQIWGRVLPFAIAAVLIVLIKITDPPNDGAAVLLYMLPLVLGFILFLIFASARMTVRFDDERIVMSFLGVGKEIAVSDITRMSYYINKQKYRGREKFILVMSIEYSGKKAEMWEYISSGELDMCRTGDADKELFVLYDHLRSLRPETAKGLVRNGVM